MIGFLLAAISGALMSIQGVFNTQATKATSMWLCSSFVQLTAFAVCVAAWGIRDRTPVVQLFQVQPKYMLLGGVIGAMITVTVIQSMNQLGPARAVMMIVVVQIFTAYIIELLGIFGVERQAFQWQKLLGMLLAIAGILIFKWES